MEGDECEEPQHKVDLVPRLEVVVRLVEDWVRDELPSLSRRSEAKFAVEFLSDKIQRLTVVWMAASAHMESLRNTESLNSHSDGHDNDSGLASPPTSRSPSPSQSLEARDSASTSYSPPSAQHRFAPPTPPGDQPQKLRTPSVAETPTDSEQGPHSARVRRKRLDSDDGPIKRQKRPLPLRPQSSPSRSSRDPLSLSPDLSFSQQSNAQPRLQSPPLSPTQWQAHLEHHLSTFFKQQDDPVSEDAHSDPFFADVSSMISEEEEDDSSNLTLDSEAQPDEEAPFAQGPSYFAPHNPMHSAEPPVLGQGEQELVDDPVQADTPTHIQHRMDQLLGLGGYSDLRTNFRAPDKPLATALISALRPSSPTAPDASNTLADVDTDPVPVSAATSKSNKGKGRQPVVDTPLDDETSLSSVAAPNISKGKGKGPAKGKPKANAKRIDYKPTLHFKMALSGTQDFYSGGPFASHDLSQYWKDIISTIAAAPRLKNPIKAQGFDEYHEPHPMRIKEAALILALFKFFAGTGVAVLNLKTIVQRVPSVSSNLAPGLERVTRETSLEWNWQLVRTLETAGDQSAMGLRFSRANVYDHHLARVQELVNQQSKYKGAVSQSFKEIGVRIAKLDKPKPVWAKQGEPAHPPTARGEASHTHRVVKSGRNWSTLRKECGVAALALLPRFETYPYTLANYHVERVPEPWLLAFLSKERDMVDGLQRLSQGLEADIFNLLVFGDAPAGTHYGFEDVEDTVLLQEAHYSSNLAAWCRPVDQAMPDHDGIESQP